MIDDAAPKGTPPSRQLAARWIRKLSEPTALLGMLLVAVLASLVWLRSHPEMIGNYGVGEPAPDFDLALLDGGRVRLQGASLPTLVSFFATWCPPCRDELPALDRLQQRFRARGVRVLAVNVEEADALPAIRQLVADKRLKLPIALGGEQAAARYRVESLPHAVIVDGAGKVRRVFLGPHGESELGRALEGVLRDAPPR